MKQYFYKSFGKQYYGLLYTVNHLTLSQTEPH